MARTKKYPAVKCVWKVDQHSDSWDTDCANKFQFSDGGPTANGFEFCPYCGRLIRQLGELEEGR